MITSLHLENYMSFKNLDLNLKKGKEPKKIIAIYGENGSGKSNIISAFQNLIISLNTVNNQARMAKLQSQVLKNSSSENDNFILDLLKNGEFSDTELKDVFSNSYMIGTSKPMKIRFDFEVENSQGYYELIFSKNNNELYLSSEKLNYLINKARGNFFQISRGKDGTLNTVWSPSLFKKGIKGIVDDASSRMWGKHTFLSIFSNIMTQTNRKYIEENVSKNFLIALEGLRTISYRSEKYMGINKYSALLRDMTKGRLDKDEISEKKLRTTKIALNKFFVPLYSDINKMYYKTENYSKEKQSYELFESKRIDGKEIEVPFTLESHGTRRLMELFPLFLNAVNGETVVIDEIDQGIHDLLIDRVIDNLKEDIEGQLIFTTHDTQIMKQLNASSVYVIQVDRKGKKRVINLTKGTKDNITANNNIQKKYLEGYFAGIPYSSDVDFYDIINELGEQNNG